MSETLRYSNLILGRKTSTKYPNTWGREDITHQYKFREGSVLERSAVKNAMSKSDNYPYRAMKKGKLKICFLVKTINVKM